MGGFGEEVFHAVDPTSPHGFELVEHVDSCGTDGGAVAADELLTPAAVLRDEPGRSSTATCFCTAAKLIGYRRARDDTECSPRGCTARCHGGWRRPAPGRCGRSARPRSFLQPYGCRIATCGRGASPLVRCGDDGRSVRRMHGSVTDPDGCLPRHRLGAGERHHQHREVQPRDLRGRVARRTPPGRRSAPASGPRAAQRAGTRLLDRVPDHRLRARAGSSRFDVLGPKGKMASTPGDTGSNRAATAPTSPSRSPSPTTSPPAPTACRGQAARPHERRRHAADARAHQGRRRVLTPRLPWCAPRAGSTVAPWPSRPSPTSACASPTSSAPPASTVDVLGFGRDVHHGGMGPELDGHDGGVDGGRHSRTRMLGRDRRPESSCSEWPPPPAVTGDGTRRPMTQRGLTHLCFRVERHRRPGRGGRRRRRRGATGARARCCPARARPARRCRSCTSPTRTAPASSAWPAPPTWRSSGRNPPEPLEGRPLRMVTTPPRSVPWSIGPTHLAPTRGRLGA